MAGVPASETTEVTDVDEVLDAVVSRMGGARREGQHEMARAVAAALEGAGHLMVQAGTGTGKSLAYLVPTLLHAVRSGERAVISTATLALQRQVLGHDLPLVEGVVKEKLPRPPAVALLKGWHNYLCKHKITGGYPPEEDAALFDMAPESSSSAEEHPAAASSRDDSLGGQVVRVRAWAEETDSGDRDDLVPGVSDRAWRQASVTSMECIGQSCPLRSECFPELARQAARTADVVVTNHAMLGIAASGSPGALPEFDALVVDEAHELPSRVTAQASVELSAPAVERVARLARRQAGTATQALDDAAALLRTVLTATPEGRWPDALPPEIEGAVRAVADASRQVVSSIKQDNVKAGSKAGDAGGGLAQARSAALVLFEITDRLLSDRLRNREDVVWCSRGTGPGEAIKINVAPLDVAGPIAGQLLAGRGAVLTSATLTLGGTFDATAGSMGMGGADYTALEVASPFDYGRQGIVYVAKHLPKPGRDGTDPRVMDEIAELIEAAGGRTLGLFSSRRGATAAAEAMRERLGTPVLVQGEDSIPSLVRDFAADPATSLFGTLSLWQGVDVPGDACQLVLIDRIPFPRPDDPVMAARTEVVAKRGGNGFMAVSATHAALLLAQGAGRLIRGVSDRGVVAILDPRVATARYGTFLSRSLPPLWPTTDPAIVRAALRRLREPAAR